MTRQAQSNTVSEHTALSLLDRSQGCLLGGAAGDALGAPVEFMHFREIRDRFGPGGIRDFVPAYRRIGAITDDTQMTLFTGEGFIRAYTRSAWKGICHPPSVIHHAYMRWLRTQDVAPKKLNFEIGMDGWLIKIRELWATRAPGRTCISALRSVSQLGEPAVNNSKGCGGVMRVAPVGIGYDREHAFELGSQSAALTHGHPSGYLSAGFMAHLIAEIIAGEPLQLSIQKAKLRLKKEAHHDEVLTAIENAETLAKSTSPDNGITSLGEGWIAEEALAIAIYCSLSTSSFEDAVVMAVNHSGDSDSTGAITGNLCGALYGTEAVPRRWLKDLELRDEITLLATELAAVHDGTLDLDSDSTSERYPGW
ncbi:MAG: ADP-ribosylglycohydrolase family protein [Bryobacteraceae bacterium]